MTHKAFAELGRQLREIVQARSGRCPEVAASPNLDGGREVLREFPHPPIIGQRSWLRNHGCGVNKAGAVEIGMKKFLEFAPDQPWSVFHELAHAYHHRELGENNATVSAAFEAARLSGRYEQEDIKGPLGHAQKCSDNSAIWIYAMCNSEEYFAELSEAYFGKNDQFPRDREELRLRDPVGYDMIKRCWSANHDRLCPASFGGLRHDRGTTPLPI